MTSSASQPYSVDWRYIKKVWREITASEYLKEKIDAIPEVVDNVHDRSTDKALSANQWRLLQDQIDELKTPWKFLANWNSATWLSEISLSTNPYVYSNWDYFVVTNVSDTTNYKPDWIMYTDWVASDVEETDAVSIDDRYMFNWNDWVLIPASQIQIAIDQALSSTSTNPVENRVIKAKIDSMDAEIEDKANASSGATWEQPAWNPGDIYVDEDEDKIYIKWVDSWKDISEWWWGVPEDVYTKTEADNKFLAQNYVHTYNITDDNISVIEKVNGFLYTTNETPITSNNAEIRSSGAHTAIRYDVSQLVGQSIHISTKRQSKSTAREIGIIYFITGTNTIIQKILYRDYASASNQAVSVEKDLVVPNTATELWVWSTKALMPEPICVLNNPIVQHVSKSLMDILTDYMNTVVDESTLSTIPLSEKIEQEIEQAIQPTQKTINLLFVGNSLTQDGVSYLPMVLKSIAPDLNFNIWIWYDGGYKLSQILGKWNNGTTASIVSNANNVTSWTNYNNSKTIEFILSQAKFDIVILEEYFTYMESYGAAELTVFENTVNYLRNHMNYSFKLAFLFHMVHLTQQKDSGDIDIDERFQFMKTATQLIYDNEPISSIIPLGFASYRASKTELNSLGDVGGLSPDYTHAQEGLPCQMLAWTTATWLFNQLGMTNGILNDKTRINSSNYSSINVPWPNLGSGLVIGTEAQYILAQKLAIQATKECNDTFKFTIPTNS